jgi:endothelin-converting enzyme/putative endopeptidase
MPYSPSLDVTNLDRSADPCVDFYKFSCGGWQKNNPIPADQSGWSVYAKLGNENQQFLWGILEADAKAKNRTPVQQKVGDYFAACMNTAAIDALGLKPVQPELARIDALKTRPELVAAISELHHAYPGSFFFGSGTGQDAMDSSLVIVELGAGGLGLPDRDYYLKTDPKSIKLREQYVAYIRQLLTLSGESADQAKANADAILRIETELAKASLTRVPEKANSDHN